MCLWKNSEFYIEKAFFLVRVLEIELRKMQFAWRTHTCKLSSMVDEIEFSGPMKFHKISFFVAEFESWWHFQKCLFRGEAIYSSLSLSLCTKICLFNYNTDALLLAFIATRWYFACRKKPGRISKSHKGWKRNRCNCNLKRFFEEVSSDLRVNDVEKRNR